MKSFLTYLKENKIDQNIDMGNEKYYSITESGLEPIEDEEDIFDQILDDPSFDVELTEADGKTEIGQEGWGGERYFSLDAPILKNEIESVNEAKKTDAKKADEKSDSKTLQDLKYKAEHPDTDIEKVKDRHINYIVDKDGYTLLKKDEKTGERRKLTDDEIKEIVNRKNSESQWAKKTHFEFNENGELVQVDNKDPEKKAPIKEKYRTGLLKTLNDKVNDRGLHFKWVPNSSKLMVNTTKWDDSDKRDEGRFDKVDYEEIKTDELKNDILSQINKKKQQKSKDVIGFENGHFTKNGEIMSEKDFKSFVQVLNSGVGDTTKLLNPKAWGKTETPYWETYKISVAGSKVGDAVNFNLPPVKTCHKKVLPCAKLCYAVKSYGAYKGVAAAEDCNFELLKRDKGFELFKKSMIYALTTPRKGGGGKFSLCRFHVSGDFFSAEYLKAICEVAKACPDVKCWLYTKQYEILSEVGKSSIPDNLCVIVSCWGDYNPFDYENGKYEQLAHDFPLAYLDDETEEFTKFNQKIQEKLGKPKDIQYCPCTKAEEIITRCEDCKICFDKTLAKNNLVFHLH